MIYLARPSNTNLVKSMHRDQKGVSVVHSDSSVLLNCGRGAFTNVNSPVSKGKACTIFVYNNTKSPHLHLISPKL